MLHPTLKSIADVMILVRKILGGTLVLLLGTPAAGAIVTAIGDWLALRNRASITVKRADEQIVVQNITSKKAGELAQLLLSKP
jgi:hypothetical protein